ncbi:hypothetical protein ESY86_06750 [Subsaximicrobium wynnwilliamsii]|uniref:Uncharacterized protein n=1 Tax=Subsaximicrobium wynnwilliamsii TaxID=291179 RepID=A0A5C6ZKL7_9FLAO|nr:hypothetical protein [Subsaximicrobium wynnwilliamsii]TXD84273.1 hypothetical protein ESY87_07165 [Subsaximicrobium wynnwilliamsii]TXD89894.1 hypothetical protein ESY86_06750 [Subsaximicrobium wynnwilliamsii]TXE03985.1 hypothetical protein ESY88_07160 [Subsaximicrobium wynnwilliamsii]
MAEIKIKKKTSIWPWIVAILAILAILYFVFIYSDDDAEADDVSDNDIEMVTDDVDNTANDAKNVFSETAISKIAEFKTHIAEGAEMGLEHEYSHAALDKLIDATQAVANTLNVDIAADLETARSIAGSVEDDTYAVDHADNIKNAGNTIVKVLKKIQMQRFPNLDESCTELQNSVMAIAPGTQTLEQKAAVKNFFDQAGELLTNMKNK